MKHILITGGAGFIGSNFVKYILDRYKDYIVINVDSLTYAGNLDNLIDISKNPNYSFVHADISNAQVIEDLFKSYSFDYVVNFAAESHVDRSILDPEIFLKSNVLGTHVLLEAAKKNWKKNPLDIYSREYKNGVKFLQVSTDEVYGTLGKTGLFTESNPIMPNSPYSASKASADLFVRAYYETFGLPINITRCSNNYGPYQYPEKLIPLMIEKCMRNEKLPVYGNGLQVRDWLHVQDHCSAIDKVLHEGAEGEVYNIGGNNEKTNLEIVRLILRYFGKDDSLIEHVKDRPGHDARYAIDSSKISNNLGWRPKFTFDEGITNTIEWYLNNKEWANNLHKKKNNS